MSGRAFLSTSAHRKTTHIVQAGGTSTKLERSLGTHTHTECFKKAEVYEISDEHVYTAVQSLGRHM